MTKRRLTQEERVAQQLNNIVSDVRLDLDLVGVYLVRLAPTISYNRLMLIAESAEFEKESIDVRHGIDPLF